MFAYIFHFIPNSILFPFYIPRILFHILSTFLFLVHMPVSFYPPSHAKRLTQHKNAMVPPFHAVQNIVVSVLRQVFQTSKHWTQMFEMHLSSAVCLCVLGSPKDIHPNEVYLIHLFYRLSRRECKSCGENNMFILHQKKFMFLCY